jgi:hypothetical protein
MIVIPRERDALKAFEIKRELTGAGPARGKTVGTSS